MYNNYVCDLSMHVESMKDFRSENAADISASFSLCLLKITRGVKLVEKKNVCKCTCIFIGARLIRGGGGSV